MPPVNPDTPVDTGSSTGDAVETVISEFLERYDSPSAADVEALCAQNPIYSSEIRRRLDALSRLGLWGTSRAADDIPERLGEFRLLRRLGGGGMGVVYLAEQTSLHRVVALKLIRPEHLYFPGARERFKREVEAVAKLQHPGIVPVYTVGEERGIPYFAMERIVGCTLAEVIQQLGNINANKLSAADLDAVILQKIAGEGAESRPKLYHGSWWEICIKTVRDVALALDHAHGRGVLHRDIKPSNILLASDGRVLLFDFGLASSEGAAQLTRSGSQVGSVPYMAPEVVNGESKYLSGLADLYSLGVTLYELLTLRSPFLGETVDATQRNIMEGDPSPPRQWNTTIPNDAATVCLKAMDRDRSRRYPSAAAFAADLTNILERRPIVAKPPSTIRKFQRWVERHPTQSVAAVLGILLLTGIPTTVAVSQYLHSRELEKAYERERNQRTLAGRNFNLAVDAVERMLTRVGDRELVEIPQTELIRQRLLEDALQFSESLLKEKSDDPVARRETGRALARVAEIRRWLGAVADSEQAVRQAVTIFEQLTKDYPAESVYRLDLCHAHRLYALLLMEPARADEAVVHLQKALELRREWMKSGAADSHINHQNADLLTDRIELGRALFIKQNYANALATVEGALRDAGEGVAAENLNYQADAYLLISQIKSSQQLFAEAETAGRIAVETLEKLVALPEARAHQRQRLASSYNSLAMIVGRLGENEEKYKYFKKSIEIREALVRDFPKAPTFIHQLAQSENNLALAYQKDEDFEAANINFKKCVERMKGLVAVFPDTLDYQLDCSTLIINQCSNLVSIQKTDEAMAALREEINELEGAAKRNPTLSQLYDALARAYNNLGTIYSEQKKQPLSEEAYRKGIENMERAVSLAPEAKLLIIQLAGMINNLGVALHEMHRFDDSRPVLLKAAELLESRLPEFDATPEVYLQLAEYYNDVAVLELAVEKSEAARVMLEKTLKYQKAALAASGGSDATGIDVGEHSYFILRNLFLLKDFDLALSYARDVGKIIKDRNSALLHSASLLALCSANDPDAARAESIAKESILQIASLLDAGFDSLEPFMNDGSFKSLRDRKDFIELMDRHSDRLKK